MSSPPIGYDDDSVIPKKRLTSLLEDFEANLNTIRRVFEQTLATEFESSNRDYAEEFALLKSTAEEVGDDYAFLVEQLQRNYENFSQSPDRERLGQLFKDVKQLQLLLVG